MDRATIGPGPASPQVRMLPSPYGFGLAGLLASAARMAAWSGLHRPAGPSRDAVQVSLTAICRPLGENPRTVRTFYAVLMLFWLSGLAVALLTGVAVSAYLWWVRRRRNEI